jgi:TonB family protein
MMEWIMRRAFLAALFAGLAGCASPSTMTAEQRAEMNRWVSEVSKKIQSRVYYPRDPAVAAPMLSGTARVQFTVRGDGTIYTPQVVKSSAFPIFDGAALTIVLSAAPLPPPPAFLVQRNGSIPLVQNIVFVPPNAIPAPG